jgi:hypothetical protein
METIRTLPLTCGKLRKINMNMLCNSTTYKHKDSLSQCGMYFAVVLFRHA